MKQVLIDTHVWLWMLRGEERFSKAGASLLGDRNLSVLVSAISFAEVGIKVGLGKLSLPVEPRNLRQFGDFSVVDVNPEMAMESGLLPRHHKDPFDRMLVAQARLLGCPLISADREMTRYDVKVIDPTA